MWSVGLLCVGFFEGFSGNPDGVSSLLLYSIHAAMPHGSAFIILCKKPLAAYQRSRYGVLQTMFWDGDGRLVFVFVFCSSPCGSMLIIRWEVSLQFLIGRTVLWCFNRFSFNQIECVNQGSSNLSLEGQSAAELSSNPDQTHLPVIF